MIKAMPVYFSLFSLFFYLGCISFGGPTAHIALFQKELIEKRKWMSSQQYLQLVAFCQFLPGPSSSQVGMALGFLQKGYLGAFVAWLGFTLPSALILTTFAYGTLYFDIFSAEALLQGLKLAACAIVAYAVLSMIQQICETKLDYALMLVIAVSCAYLGSEVGQWVWIITGAVIGTLVFRAKKNTFESVIFKISNPVAYTCLALFIALFFILASLSHQNFYISIADIFYRAGALVFGGGHVVLPLLERDIVGNDLLAEQTFLAGYGLVQAMPGPLFNFATYLGAVLIPSQPIVGALFATVMIFIPAALILFGTLPFIQKIAQVQWLQSALLGVNLAVVGLLLATFYDPILLGSVKSIFDAVLVLLLFALLYFKKMPVWGIVLLSCAVSFII